MGGMRGAQSECFRSGLQLGLQDLTLQIEVTLISCAQSSAVWVLKAPEKRHERNRTNAPTVSVFGLLN